MLHEKPVWLGTDRVFDSNSNRLGRPRLAFSVEDSINDRDLVNDRNLVNDERGLC